jgi:hypothetical protein
MLRIRPLGSPRIVQRLSSSASNPRAAWRIPPVLPGIFLPSRVSLRSRPEPRKRHDGDPIAGRAAVAR